MDPSPLARPRGRCWPARAEDVIGCCLGLGFAFQACLSFCLCTGTSPCTSVSRASRAVGRPVPAAVPAAFVDARPAHALPPLVRDDLDALARQLRPGLLGGLSAP